MGGRIAEWEALRDPIPEESRGYYPGREDKGQARAGQDRAGQARAEWAVWPATGLASLSGAGPHAWAGDMPDYNQGGYGALAQVTGGSSLPPGVNLPPGVTPPPGGPVPTETPAPRRSWAQKLGLGNISTRVFGHVKGGAGARDESTLEGDGDWEATGLLDGYAGGEVSAVTPGGIEYGLMAGLRGAYDPDGVLFGGLVGDCAAGNVSGNVVGGAPGCAGQIVAGGETFALRGHTSQLFTGAATPSDAIPPDNEARLVLEAAHLFVRSPYGDLTVGRDVGAGELFSLGAPTLLRLGLNNGRADYTSLDVVTTANDPTGYSEKITYTSPRLGGDRFGIGAQLGASYTPDVDACGVYTCFRRNGDDLAGGSVGATLEDAWEVALSLEKRLGALAGEVTATYAQASVEQSLAAFDDLQSWNVGTRWEWRDFVLGGSYLSSNNALADGDYTAWDLGLTWRTPWAGVTLGYASAEDDNVELGSDQYLLGLSREVPTPAGGVDLGLGLQYIEREVPGLAGPVQEDGVAVFVETGWEF